jgi:adenosylcobinamide-phosphate synthase
LWVERLSGDRPEALRLGGGLITAVLVLGAGSCGWLVEQLARAAPFGTALLVLGLASALAARSLHDSVAAILSALPDQPQGDLTAARERLSWIVGRDVQQLREPEILRAAAESASENAVDGLFAPLFWMIIGLVLQALSPQLPGPLALAWAFKASSTLDSMLGYRRGRLRWLGTAGARLDDLLTWLPCRLVMITLPLVSQPWRELPALVRAAERDGAPDPSPNAGRSEAIYAHCAGVQLGGRNRYGERWIDKPVLAANLPQADRNAVNLILVLTSRLESLWLLLLLLVALLVAGQ